MSLLARKVFCRRALEAQYRLAFDYKVIAESGLFDAAWYARQYPEAASAGTDLLLHYLLFGSKEGRDPGPHFSTVWYVKEHPDVAQSSVNPLAHFVLHGKTEGRLPRPRKTVRGAGSAIPPLAERIAAVRAFIAQWERQFPETSRPAGPGEDRPEQPAAQPVPARALANRHPSARRLARLGFASTAEPEVSVVIPVHGQLDYTLRCLLSVKDNVQSVAYEVILVDDASDNKTSRRLSRVRGMRYIYQPDNRGFVGSCNNGAQAARGKLLCFLNNDTLVDERWLENLVLPMSDPSVGIVGAKLVYFNGLLQEAGGIIWRDGVSSNYGNRRDPGDPEFNYRRDVDYCSGASLLVRKDLFDKLGGFSTLFAPAYFEDSDLCMACRGEGLRVVYQPESTVVHYESLSYGSGLPRPDLEAKRKAFQDKWENDLAQHLEDDRYSMDLAARRLQGQPSVMIVDDGLPQAGAENPLQELIDGLLVQGCSLIYAPLDGVCRQPAAVKMQRLGVEVLYATPAQPNVTLQLAERLDRVDMVWACRRETRARLLELFPSLSADSVLLP